VIKEAIGKLVEGGSLSEEEAAAVMGEIMTGGWIVLRVETLSLGAVLRLVFKEA
jgi:anthranilate phosphoribosyltransferase